MGSQFGLELLEAVDRVLWRGMVAGTLTHRVRYVSKCVNLNKNFSQLLRELLLLTKLSETEIIFLSVLFYICIFL